MLISLRKNLSTISTFDWLVMGVLFVLFAIAVIVPGYSFNQGSAAWWPWLDGLFQNSGTEMLGALLTFVMLEVIRGYRARQAEELAEQERSEQLMALQRELTLEIQRQLRDYIQGQALSRLRTAETPKERLSILDEMNANDLLHGANLKHANLQDANLELAGLPQ